MREIKAAETGPGAKGPRPGPRLAVLMDRVARLTAENAKLSKENAKLDDGLDALKADLLCLAKTRTEKWQAFSTKKWYLQKVELGLQKLELKLEFVTTALEDTNLQIQNAKSQTELAITKANRWELIALGNKRGV
jgi:chromosome segregation ATPase